MSDVADYLFTLASFKPRKKSHFHSHSLWAFAGSPVSQ